VLITRSRAPAQELPPHMRRISGAIHLVL